jgi:hypothetical protein
MDFPGNGRIIESLEAADANFNASMHSGAYQGKPEGALHASLNVNNGMKQAMTKSLEVMSEAVRNPKHPFRKVDNQPKKPLKHRYERRKIREYLHLGDWVSGEAA